MSARDSESGSSTYKGGSGSAGGMGNAGLGGGSGAGGQGGGYGGGMTQNTGMSTGNKMYGNTAFGNPGRMATGYATRDARSLGQAGMRPTSGTYGNFKTMLGNPMFRGSPVQGQSFTGMGAGQAFGRAKQAYDAWKNSQIEQSPLNRPTTNRTTTSRPKPSVVSPVTPPELDIPEPLPFPPAEELPEDVVPAPVGWTPAASVDPSLKSIPRFANLTRSVPGRNWSNNPAHWPKQTVPGVRDTGSTTGGFPSLDPGGAYPPGLYASGGLVRSAMLTAKGVSNGMKGALVVNQKGNVVSGKLKSGPIVQVGKGGNVTKRGTVKITWGS